MAKKVVASRGGCQQTPQSRQAPRVEARRTGISESLLVCFVACEAFLRFLLLSGPFVVLQPPFPTACTAFELANDDKIGIMSASSEG